MRTNDNLLITVLGKPMRFLRNFLRKLKITTFFNMDITGPGFVITSSSSHDGPHFLSRLVIHRKSPILQRGKNTGYPKMRKWRKYPKTGFLTFYPRRIFPDIHFTVFNFFDFSFLLGPNLGQMTSLSYFFFQSLSLFLYHFLLKYYLTYTNLT